MRLAIFPSAISPKVVTRRLLMLFQISILVAGNAFAQTTWTGQADSDWKNAANWSAGVPGADDAVIIPLRPMLPSFPQAWLHLPNQCWWKSAPR
jgi:hypothetical protein